LLILKNALPNLSTLTNKTLSGNILSEVEEGVSTTTGSETLTEAVSIKKVTKRKAKSTMGVISSEGFAFGIFILGMFFCFKII
jgi:hypothetical protein